MWGESSPFTHSLSFDHQTSQTGKLCTKLSRGRLLLPLFYFYYNSLDFPSKLVLLAITVNCQCNKRKVTIFPLSLIPEAVNFQGLFGILLLPPPAMFMDLHKDIYFYFYPSYTTCITQYAFSHLKYKCHFVETHTDVAIVLHRCTIFPSKGLYTLQLFYWLKPFKIKM